MRNTICTVAAFALFGTRVFGQGAILWNESVNGPLSELANSPTPLGSLVNGTNSILGATQVEPTGNDWLIHEDVFTFVVPGNAHVTGVFFTVDKPKVGSWIGDVGYSIPLGSAINSANGDLLPQWGMSLLGPGTYGMYLGNYDPQPSSSTANYRLDFVVQNIPEPGAPTLGALGVAGFAAWRAWRRISRR